MAVFYGLTWKSTGKTALMLACQLGRLDAVELLLSAGSDPSVKDKVLEILL